MAETQMNKKTLRNSKATTIHELYTDCLVSIFTFVKPLEMWNQRLTCSHWHEATPVALSRVTTYDFDVDLDEEDEEYERHRFQQVVDLCPNLTFVHSGYYSNPWVKKFDIQLPKPDVTFLFLLFFFSFW